MLTEGTIIALSTAAGQGAIAVLRLSGSKAITTVDRLFKARSGKPLNTQKSHTVHLGDLMDKQTVVDEVLVTLFKGPHSYTGEDVVEISCHGSVFIQEKILRLFLDHGIQAAQPGEFTLRAFVNGKMDLSQAEAVSDLIASENAASHAIALQQMRGGFSDEIKKLREQLLNFASLIELELDFAEEDVAFADREAFIALLKKIESLLKHLLDSFALGNVLKKGVPVAIVGPPNAGKSTLLNALLNEDKAIISAIAGTTRDSIEDEITLDGIAFRFIDTDGIRETEAVAEKIGIQKTFEKLENAAFVFYLIDSTDKAQHQAAVEALAKINSQYPDKPLLVVWNKMDKTKDFTPPNDTHYPSLAISAKEQTSIDALQKHLVDYFQQQNYSDQTVLSNARHYGALNAALGEIIKVQQGIDDHLSSDLLAIDLRQALYHLGEITGEVTNDELLGNIFSKFCIWK